MLIKYNGFMDYTKIIQEAIDNYNYIEFEKGVYKLGCIKIKSDVEINLNDSVLSFIKDKKHYEITKSNFEGEERIRLSSCIEIKNQKNVKIYNGTINGEGEKWRYIKDFKLNKKEIEEFKKHSPYSIKTNEGEILYPSKSMYEGALIGEENIKDYDLYYDLFLPIMVKIENSENVALENLVLTNSPIWNTHILFSSNVLINKCTFRNPDYGQSTDGLDIESSNNVKVINSIFDCGDDAICLKAGKGLKALELSKKKCENIEISNCTIYKAHGGIVIGSETSRGIKNVNVKNINFIETEIGLRFKSARGRCGIIENINLSNLYMLNIKKEAVLFDTSYKLYKLNEKEDLSKTTNKLELPEFKNFTISNLICDKAFRAIKIIGLEDLFIHDIKFIDCRFLSLENSIFENCEKIYFINSYDNLLKLHDIK